MKDSPELGGFSAGTVGRGEEIEPSIWNALPHFVPLAIFPLVINAAIYGGWWIAGPFVYFLLADRCDAMLGMDERNMDPRKTRESQLFWYKLTIWLWALFWPATLLFVLWQILVIGHLSAWETVLMVVVAGLAQSAFIVGHEMVHRRSVWEHRIGEFVLASVSYPHYATEHVYMHHALVGTPADSGSAPKGQSFWQYFPRDLKSNLLGAWHFERNRQARRRQPVWHYTNPFWRYFLETAAWYALAYWMGGPWMLLIYAVVCFSAIMSMKIINYAQHYGLQRIRLPNGRFERTRPRAF